MALRVAGQPLMLLLKSSVMGLGVLASLFANTGYAHNAKAQQTYDENRLWVEQQLKGQKGFVQTIQPQNLFENYQANPSQSTYYEGRDDHLRRQGREAAIRTGQDKIARQAQEAIEGQALPQAAKDYDSTVSLAEQLNDSNAFCVEGDCSRPVREESHDFYKSVAMLSGAADASAQLINNGIFNGQAQTCRKITFGIMNCCADTGWANSLHLTHCRDEEKKLGKAKESHLTVYVGEYCAHKKLGKCTEHKKSYCVFSSKLAQIIQVQGRAQLGLSFGRTKSPDCRGLSPDELQRINFETIDYTDYYNDIQAKTTLLNENDLQQKANQAAQGAPR